MVNKGTLEGEKEEIIFVKELNKKNQKFWDILKLDSNNHYGVHVKTKQYGKISEQKVLPKADAFIAKGELSPKFLRENDFYVNDKQINDLNLVPVKYSGISIKRPDSRNYQIQKFTPSTFRKIFGSYELGAGASLYSKKEADFKKNIVVIEGWKTNLNNLLNFFWEKYNLDISKDNSDFCLNDAKTIKNFSTKKIKELIENNIKISNFVFQGIGNFEEPYNAYFLYEKGELKTSCQIHFNVTTGSGRSKGDFTVVLKPKSH
ncbi:hypothetical protein [Methanobrevibacter curvatus]|uniref:Uncharacterized protein n=1 Tax=Methanobrevibacter curvatus TaxID=49547 RepID=A0A166B5A7_9EURY|nr:hypothetical protein [Methanobrevibacter curvatus]KZX12882.1 hypothetical protein MBCUR_08430 [Methanobrevibacter curvatus]